MAGEDDDETLIASKDWMPPQPNRPRPAAGAAPQQAYPGAGQTLPMPGKGAAAGEGPQRAPAPSAAESLAAGDGAFGTPPFVMTFLIVCGVLTALGLIALIYLEM
ncbi:MAG: hypothetical protein ABJE95_24955 [Byssovorax sp.]